jgi:hypothetical protein
MRYWPLAIVTPPPFKAFEVAWDYLGSGNQVGIA